MKHKKLVQKQGNFIVGLGFLLTTFSFTVLINGTSRIVVAILGVVIATYGLHLLEKEKKSRSQKQN